MSPYHMLHVHLGCMISVEAGILNVFIWLAVVGDLLIQDIFTQHCCAHAVDRVRVVCVHFALALPFIRYLSHLYVVSCF